MTAPLLAIDAPSLYFRAFHGVPAKAAMAPDGTPVNAVRGFLDMVTTLVKGRRPGRLVCALDYDWRPAWRVALIGTYKTHRVAPEGGEEVPDELVPQVDLLLEVLDAFGIVAYGVDGNEADDVLGTLAATQAAPVEVVSGDRDLFQLVDDKRGVRLLYVGRGVAKLEDCDEAAVLAKYGVPAGGYADFAALRGDPSDGLPGVAGVGEKTAARLIERYGSLDAIVAAVADPASDFAPGLRAKLEAASAYLAVAPKVVRVATDLKLPEHDLTLPRVPRDPERLFDLAEQWNLASPCRRLVDALAENAA
ncbi:5'-3' exonuclease H3TH domain-containing protein [Catellatospora aurea]|uniref:5'-3' exonuclease n=1 Tax=Catellatospora aurea TaxID=1337874 RepID=A0ABW2H0B9_9ACTN